VKHTTSESLLDGFFVVDVIVESLIWRRWRCLTVEVVDDW